MSQVVLYFNDLDNSIGKIISDNISPCLMLILSFSIWSYLFVNKTIYKENKSAKTKSGLFVDYVSQSQINKLQCRYSKQAFFTGLVMFFFALKLLFSELVHKEVHDLELEVNNSNYFQSNLTARQILLPSRCLWAIACIFAGCTSSILVILSYLVISTEISWQNIKEGDHSMRIAATDNSQISLIASKMHGKSVFCLIRYINRCIKSIKHVFILCSLLIFFAVFTLETTRMLLFIADNKNNLEVNQLNTSFVKVLNSFGFINTSRMWFVNIPAALITLTSFLFAIISTSILIISTKAENKIPNELFRISVSYKKARIVQTVGSWLFVIGPMLQVLLQSCVTNCPSVDFNHNAVYHVVIAVASVLTSFTAIYMQVLSTKIC